MKEQWIREGFSNYYTVKKQADITYEKKILLQHSLECLLPCEFRMEDEEEYYYFETGMYLPFMKKINQIDPAAFFYEFFCSLEEIEAYLLNLDHLKIEEGLIFLRDERHPVFCYLPEQEKNIYDQIQEFLEECMEKISYNDRKKTRIYYELHSYLAKEKPNIRQIKEFLKPKPEEKKITEQQPAAEERYKEKSEPVDGKNRTVLVKEIILVILSFLCIGIAAFFTVKLMVYGLYYKFVLGFLGAVLGFGVDAVCLLKIFKEENSEEEMEEEETEFTRKLTEDDQKTVLLLELPMGYLRKTDQDERIELTGKEFVIGSQERGTDYQLKEVGVSRRHVRFWEEEGEVWAEDLNSTNGTKVNGKRIQRQKLNHGDVVVIAREEFCYEEAVGTF
ncbi:MAG TPA: FHA domain-containing protein [Candidatus Anaerostipes avicola]|uniref:DUF6382 domain-containing protein n=1 Tax=Anaerostipes butyraticus TaxID=645466 RepID=UPI001FA3D6CE|nr:DUF6382 domain-containing protein [Anaerostipes butyraticus]HJC82207.1 FHA domain-containing protein [Candidatus Anaerostipes avicola]